MTFEIISTSEFILAVNPEFKIDIDLENGTWNYYLWKDNEIVDYYPNILVDKWRNLGVFAAYLPLSENVMDLPVLPCLPDNSIIKAHEYLIPSIFISYPTDKQELRQFKELELCFASGYHACKKEYGIDGTPKKFKCEMEYTVGGKPLTHGNSHISPSLTPKRDLNENLIGEYIF